MAEKFEYTREWTDAKAFPLLGFTKSWENPEDYPTIELDETQVRKDMQSLHDEVKNYINDKLIPAVLAEDATEAARAAAEAQREANETQRIENENASIAAEQARTTAESARAAAETERAAAESARNTAEQAREAAEQARVDETAGIVAQATEQAVIASNAASEASSSASGASTSASAAAASASSASDSASASASSATAAQASADEALSSKNSAKSEADRAKSEADRAAEIVGGDFVKSSEKGAANGVATLGEDALLAAAQRPKAGGLYRDDGTTTVEASLTEISTTLQKKADLGEDGKVPASQIPSIEVDAYTKAQTLSDTTKTLFGLDATVVPDDAFVALTDCFAQILVTTLPNIEVTASLNGKTIITTSNSSGLAVLKIPGYGVWTVSANMYGSVFSTSCEIKAIAQHKLALFPTLNELNWNTINSISNSGTASSILSVGDKKTISVNGTNYQVQIIGFNHDTKTSGGKAGITFQLVDCLNTKYQMNSSNTNSGGWTSCAMRSSMSTFLSQLDNDLQSVIKTVNKLTSAGSQSDTINTTSDKLFLLSEVEIFGSTTFSKSGEGSQYAYYKAGNSTAKKVGGSASSWWERSPCRDRNESFCVVYSNGTTNNNQANVNLGVSFAFCV